MKPCEVDLLVLGALSVVLAVLAPAEATQRSEFERFREYILNPEFLELGSVEAALMETATGQIAGQARGYVTGASSPGAFVAILVQDTWTRMTSLGPIFTERGRTTAFEPEETIEEGRTVVHRRGLWAFGLYYSYAEFKEFDGNDINSLFRGPRVTAETTDFSFSSADILTHEKYRAQTSKWRREFWDAIDGGQYQKATQMGRAAGIDPPFRGSVELVGVERKPEGTVFHLQEKFEHIRQVADATFRIKTQTATVLASFSATEWLDLTVLIPIHWIDWHSDVVREHYVDGVLVESSRAHFGDSATGLGDIALRSKFRLTHPVAAVDCAAALDLHFPTGDEDEFLGTGSFGVTPFLMASKELGPVTPYVNVGYLFDTKDSDWSRLEVKAALDFTPIARRLTIGGEFVGLIYDDFKIYDAGVALKVAPLKDKPLALGASVLFPVNDDGLRPDYVGVFGAEWSF
jgi:hypothetical protein